MLRVVRLAGAEGETHTLVFDPTGKKSGRGAYVCRTTACVEIALKRKALERSLKTLLPDAVAQSLREAVVDAPSEAQTPQVV